MAPGQAITIESALRAYTAGGAYGSFEEGIKGQIAPGMLADLVVLSQDPTVVRAEALLDIEIRRTILHGETVFEA